jgi:small subunit ribosomal protein S9
MMAEEKKKKAPAPKAKVPKEAKAESPKVEKAEVKREAKAEHAHTAEAHKAEAHSHEHPEHAPAPKIEHAPKAEAIAKPAAVGSKAPGAPLSGTPDNREAKAETPKQAAKEAAPKKKKAAPKKKAAKKVFVTRGKRKESVARATIQEGKGVVRINRVALNALNNKYMIEIIREPLRYVGPEVNSVDISVEVCGGGAMGQAQAARTAIANALVAYFDTLNLEDKFIGIDRTLVIEDTRRVETKKFRGPKARARFQKSYR